MTEYLFIEKYRIGDKFKVLRGEYTGQIGEYLGKKNNSNWQRFLVCGQEILLSDDEIEAV